MASLGRARWGLVSETRTNVKILSLFSRLQGASLAAPGIAPSWGLDGQVINVTIFAGRA
jgi:hypothetical protein